jgi:hypothetical protein
VVARVAAVVVVALALAAPAAGAAGPRVVLLAPTHVPRADAPWPYAVVVTDAAGRFLPARLHMQITLGSLPVGQVGRHAVDGLWAETLTWPKDALGQALTFEVEATAAGKTTTLRYRVANRANGPSPASAAVASGRLKASVRNVHAPRSLAAAGRGSLRWVVTCNVPGGSRTVSTSGKAGGKVVLPKPATGDCAFGVAVAR